MNIGVEETLPFSVNWNKIELHIWLVSIKFNSVVGKRWDDEHLKLMSGGEETGAVACQIYLAFCY